MDTITKTRGVLEYSLYPDPETYGYCQLRHSHADVEPAVGWLALRLAIGEVTTFNVCGECADVIRGAQ